ncbi:MAG: hypothetical protein N3E45_04555 [Oscillatoriaceae bacterium SKW80]|nr:hypothetical protein [Oscillatoriaceae bacterium SKYG93]MCX8120088.1 hypothetical protein [Oscillatoriaceae bacterium SKW80]MDW8453014.1 hypothetical protein [Oscillatoriaceae cyanobacterium SKYGB_i_bin93]HIK29075.1 hypothetical protein [Oscillatoriaceae cyanobacterium M7585_C2015_266]
MFQLIYPIVKAIQPFLVPICFVSAWIFILAVSWSIYRAIATTIASAKRMHQIPCSHCVFFTNDYRLKCPVQPKIALTEEAIGCLDYRQKQTMR